MVLLTRDQFRQQVFERDSHKCVICGAPAKDAHHIIDRSLFHDEGYYIENGVSLCEEHHLEAESTILSCEELRYHAGINQVVLPEHFEVENFESIETYDHWGNIILPNGMRVKGELFYQENVQKVLSAAGILHRFLKYTKYPKTYHAPWSPNVGRDDRVHSSMEYFLNKPLVATIKMDGENTNLYTNYYHARSINSAHHPSRSWVKSLHAKICQDIPDNWRLCGENLYAKHSIHYKHLKSYFYLFSAWNEANVALSWAETALWAQLMDIETVPVFFKGTCSSVSELENKIEYSFQEYCRGSKDEVEGYVIRIADSFPYRDFRKSLAKVVRKNHVQTDNHWMSEQVIPNILKY
jgi:hypothetical protein